MAAERLCVIDCSEGEVCVWCPLLEMLYDELPLCAVPMVTACDPGLYEVLVERADSDCDGRVIVRRVNKEVPEGVVPFKRWFTRYIEVDKLMAIGDKESDDAKVIDMSEDEKDGYEGCMAIPMQGRYACRFTDDELIITPA